MPLDLTRLSQQKLPTETVAVPEWADLFNVSEVTVGCLDTGERGLFDHGTPDDAMQADKTSVARFVAWCLREDGHRMYEEPELAAQHLACVDSRIMRRLFLACKRVNGIGVEAVETAEKN